jgi:hypothetical protein
MASSKFNLLLFKYLALLLVAIILVGLLISSPAPIDRIINIQNYLITASGIFTGIVIAYLASKLFSIKQERSVRQVEIDKLSEKLTSYRRILYAVMNSHSFWVRFDDIRKFDQKYPTLNFESLHSEGVEDELSSQFWLDEKEISHTTVDLFKAMEAIYGGNPDGHGDYWVYQKTSFFNYSLKQLSTYHMPSNQIWYYLEGKYPKMTEGLINDNNLSPLFSDNVRGWFSQIDSKFKNKEFNRHTLAELSTDFYEIYIPKMIGLTRQNTDPLPRNVNMVFLNLVIIFIFGVVIPLYTQSLCLLDQWNRWITLSCVVTITLGFCNFFFDFYRLMKSEITIK